MLCASVAAALLRAPPPCRGPVRLSAFDAEALRAEFPALHQRTNGRDLIYFDSGATSQKPARVLGALEKFYARDNANVHRGAHALATRATDAYEAARDKVAAFVGARRDEIVWTRGATEAINLVAQAWGPSNLCAGDEIVLTELEHHSNLVPCRAAKGCEIPNFKGSHLGRFPLVSADFWTSDHLSERSRSVDAFIGTRACGTLTLKRR